MAHAQHAPILVVVVPVLVAVVIVVVTILVALASILVAVTAILIALVVIVAPLLLLRFLAVLALGLVLLLARSGHFVRGRLDRGRGGRQAHRRPLGYNLAIGWRCGRCCAGAS